MALATLPNFSLAADHFDLNHQTWIAPTPLRLLRKRPARAIFDSYCPRFPARGYRSMPPRWLRGD